MSLRAWIALLLFYIIYLLIGGFTFRAIESPHECETREKAFNESQKYQESLKRIRGTKYMTVLIIYLLL